MIDEHVLEGKKTRRELVAQLLESEAPSDRAAPYYEGMRILGPRTPDLTLFALRLVLAGRRADDAAVVRLRELADAVRQGGSEASEAREEYASLLQEIS